MTTITITTTTTATIMRMTGYEAIYHGLLPRLAGCDIPSHARRMGLAMEGGRAVVPFLGRTYAIDRTGVFALDGGPVPVNTRSVLAYYILSEGEGAPSFAFVPMGRLAGALAGRNAQWSGVMDGPLTQRFGRDYLRFARAAAQVGGSPMQS